MGDLYTADSVDAITSIILVNTDSSARTVNLYLLPSGGTARRLIPKDMSLGIGYCLITDGKQISVYDASGNLLLTSAVVAHDLGGASHNADTLSNLNSKVSDATLVDTGDIILKALLTTRGDIIYRNATVPARLAKGSGGNVLTMGANDPAWAAPAAGATKEFWAPTTVVTGGSMTHWELYFVGAKLSAAAQRAYTVFHIPHDFSSITEAVLVVIPLSTQGSANWDINSSYGAIGEAYSTHQEGDSATAYNVVLSQLFEVDISGILSSITVGDHVAIRLLENNSAHDVLVLGVRFKYT